MQWGPLSLQQSACLGADLVVGAFPSPPAARQLHTVNQTMKYLKIEHHHSSDFPPNSVTAKLKRFRKKYHEVSLISIMAKLSFSISLSRLGGRKYAF